MPGFNFAFIGRPGLYHSPLATPDALDQGALQDMGRQLLDLTRGLLAAPALPGKAADTGALRCLRAGVRQLCAGSRLADPGCWPSRAVCRSPAGGGARSAEASRAGRASARADVAAGLGALSRQSRVGGGGKPITTDPARGDPAARGAGVARVPRRAGRAPPLVAVEGRGRSRGAAVPLLGGGRLLRRRADRGLSRRGAAAARRASRWRSIAAVVAASAVGRDDRRRGAGGRVYARLRVLPVAGGRSQHADDRCGTAGDLCGALAARSIPEVDRRQARVSQAAASSSRFALGVALWVFSIRSRQASRPIAPITKRGASSKRRERRRRGIVVKTPLISHAAPLDASGTGSSGGLVAR